MTAATSARPAAAAGRSYGANVTSRYPADFGSEPFRRSLRNLAATNANSVAFIVYAYQDGTQGTTFHDGYGTPDEAAIESGLRYARSLGLATSVRIHLDMSGGGWRASIDPDDRGAWFESYARLLERYARIAQRTGTGTFCLGQELIRMASDAAHPDNGSRWRELVATVRAEYAGALTYGANAGDGDQDEASSVGFWDVLDYASVSAYPALTEGGGQARWQQEYGAWADRKLATLRRSSGKSVLLSETGYRSVEGSNRDPWDYQRGGAYGGDVQARAYAAAFSALADRTYVAGIFIWEWSTDPDAGGPSDTGYTPQRKPAEVVMTAAFARKLPAATTVPEPVPSLTFPAPAAAGTLIEVSQGPARPAPLRLGRTTAANPVPPVGLTAGTPVPASHLSDTGAGVTLASIIPTPPPPPMQAARPYRVLPGATATAPERAPDGRRRRRPVLSARG